MKYAFIKANRSEISVKKMCDYLEVSRSGYYDWLHRPPSERAIENSVLSEKIEEKFVENRRVYGSPRITSALRDEGITVGENRVARIMRDCSLSARIEKKYRVQTTDSRHDLPVSPNLLNQNFDVSAANQAWVTDITYIKVGNGWCYLCAVEDLFNNEIVGWSLATHMRTEMVLDALRSAVYRRCPESGLIVHSDRGSQYASYEFREELNKNGFRSSMSRKGNCYDNAPMESFFHTLKIEEVYRKNYKTFEEAKRNLFDYIEVFYNRIRKHSSLDYLSPTQYLEMSA